MDEKNKIDYSVLNQPEPMGGGQVITSKSSYASRQIPASALPANQQPKSPEIVEEKPYKPYIPILLMVFLALILVGGVLLFFSWKGWIKIGFLGGGKASPAASVSSEISSPTPSPSESVKSSPEPATNINDQTRKSDLEKIQEALKKYFVAKGEYPISVDAMKTSDAGNILEQALVPTYLEKLPLDPLTPEYYYGYKSDGKSFEITCVLEDKTDPSAIKVGNFYIYKIINYN